MNVEIYRALFVAAVFVAGFLLGTIIYQRYTGLKRWQAAVLCLLAFGAAAAWLTALHGPGGRNFHSGAEDRQVSICAALLPFVTFPFAVRLYRKWIGNHLTVAERQPGMEGVRAWLGVGNLICASVIPLLACLGFGFSPVSLLALTFGLLLAYPLLNLASESARPAPAAPTEDLSSEREKVLQLLEAGKITVDESSELLNALGHSARPQPRDTGGINSQRKMVLAGAALLLAGFFIPWFTINPAALLNDMASQLQQSVQITLPGSTSPQNIMPAEVFPQLNFNTGTRQVHAGDIGHGLGWWILLLGLAAAILPFFATNLEMGLQKKLILVALGVGAFLLLYLMSNAIKYASFGILLALAGYVLELIGTLKERVPAR